MSLPNLHLGEGPNEGAHRLTVSVPMPTQAWGEVARGLSLDLLDTKAAAAWGPEAQLDLVGWEAEACRAHFYLAGSVLPWVAFTQNRMTVPLLTHVPLRLGQPISTWRLDRRPLTPPTYEQTVGQNYPFQVYGTGAARRIEVGTTGASSAALDGLAHLLEPAVRRSFWQCGVVPDSFHITREERCLVLPEPGLPFGAVAEVILVWAQVFWLEVTWVRFSP